MNSIVKIAPSFVKKETGPEVSRDLPPHSGTHRTGSVGGHWRWGSGSTGPARQMTRQPRHESGRAGANGPRGCPSLLGRLVGRGRAPPLTYMLTQVLTWHGCFGEYLHRIRKEATTRCHHCDASVDSAQHTLKYCPAWARPHRDLIVEIGWDVSPPANLEALLVSERGRRAVTSFCEQVMLRKEAAERVRVRNSHPERIDRRGRGRRRGRAWTRRSRAVAPPGGVKLWRWLISASGPSSSSVGEPDCFARRLRRRCILCEGGARYVARTGFRASFDRSRDGHCGGFSRLESGTTTPLTPRSGLVSVRISST